MVLSHYTEKDIECQKKLRKLPKAIPLVSTWTKSQIQFYLTPYPALLPTMHHSSVSGPTWVEMLMAQGSRLENKHWIKLVARELPSLGSDARWAWLTTPHGNFSSLGNTCKSRSSPQLSTIPYLTSPQIIKCREPWESLIMSSYPLQ